MNNNNIVVISSGKSHWKDLNQHTLHVQNIHNVKRIVQQCNHGVVFQYLFAIFKTSIKLLPILALFWRLACRDK